MSEDYIEISRKNLSDVIRDMKKHHGKIMIAEPGYGSFHKFIMDAKIGLWDRPIPENSTNFHVKRGFRNIGGEEWQTDWQKDRSYLLRLIPEETNDSGLKFLREGSEILISGDYEFKIGFQESCSHGYIIRNGRSLYIPRRSPIEPALNNMIFYMANEINKTIESKGIARSIISSEDIKKMVSFAIEDLKTGDVLMQNIGAGLAADDLFLDKIIR